MIEALATTACSVVVGGAIWLAYIIGYSKGSRSYVAASQTAMRMIARTDDKDARMARMERFVASVEAPK